MNGIEIVNGILTILHLMKSIEQMELGETPDMSLQDCAVVYKWLNENFLYTYIWGEESSKNVGRRLVAIKKRYEEGEKWTGRCASTRGARGRA